MSGPESPTDAAYRDTLLHPQGIFPNTVARGPVPRDTHDGGQAPAGTP